MKLKIGQKVQRTDNGLVGVIEEVYGDGDECDILTKEGLESAYLADLILYTFANETFRKVKGLERHSLFEISKKSPVFVVNGKAYYIKGVSEGVEKDFFLSNKERLDIVELSSLSELDNLVLSRNEKAIIDMQDKYLEAVLRNLDVNISPKENMTVPQFIFSMVFPHLRYTKEQKEARSNKISELLGAKKIIKHKRSRRKMNNLLLEQAAQNVFEEIGEMKDAIVEEYSSRYNDLSLVNQDKNSIQKGVIWDKDFALVNNGIYYLSHSEGAESGLTLRLNGKRFFLRKVGSAKGAETAYQEALTKQIRFSALNSLTKEKILEILQKRPDRAIGNLKEYHEKDFGFFSFENGEEIKYFAYLTVPAFGLKADLDDEGEYEYFLCPKKRIAIGVFKSEGKFRYDDYVERFDDKGEPDYSSRTMNDNLFCLSGIEMPTSGEDTGEVIAKRLKKVKATVLNGKSGDWYGHWEGVYRDSSLDELRRMKVKIKKIDEEDW